MLRRSLRVYVFIAAVLLLIGLALAICPQDAFAADYNYPDPEDIIMDIDNSLGSFSSTNLYYNSYTQEYSNGLGSSGFDARYDPVNGILYLERYSGSSIHVVNSDGKQLTIYLFSENTITTQGSYGILADGVRLVITADEFGSSSFDPYDIGTLRISQEALSEDSDGAGICNYVKAKNKEDIILDKTARVFIDSFFPRAGSGVRAGAKLKVTEESVLDVNVRFGVSNASSGYHGEAVYAGTGLQISNTVYANLSAASRDGYTGSYPVYALYLDSGELVLGSETEYLALSCVGKDRKVCNKTLPQTTYENDGYDYSQYDTYAASAVFYRGDYDTSDDIPASAYHFPDPSFRNYVKNKWGGSGWLPLEELATVTGVTVGSDYLDTYSLKGIEHFTGLEELFWEHAALVEADLSYNRELEYLYLYDNQLRTINICNCPKLRYLDVDNNLLTMLDVRDNTKLQTVYCGSTMNYETRNRIPVLDFSACTELQYLYTRGDEGLKSLKLGSLPDLKEMSCYGYEGSLELIDISGCPRLSDAYRFGEKDSQAQYFTKYTYDTADLRISGTAVVKTDSAALTAYPEITNCKLDLSGKIGIRIYFKAPDNAKTAKLFFESDDYQKATSSISLSKTNNPNYSSSQDVFVISYPKVTSREFTMRVKMVIYDKNGDPMNIYYSQEDKLFEGEFYYCAADWANRIIATSTNAKAKAMAKALLNYGECAQKYLSNYNAEHPANLRHYLEADMASFEPNSAYDMVVPYYAYEVGFDRVKLALEADTVMRIYCNKSVKIKVDGTSKKVYNSGDVWLAMIEGITSRNISKMYNIQIINGSDKANIEYSVLSWANDMLEREVYAAAPTAKALYFYNRAAIDYLGQN